MKKEDHNKTCAAIAATLDKIADGGFTWWDDELIEISYDDYNTPYLAVDGGIYSYYDELTIAGETYKSGYINELDEEIDPASMWDYFNDFLDIEYIVDYEKNYKACCIMVTCGGPNIYVNTWDKKVELYWWNESGSAWLDNETCAAIDDYASELYDMI